MIEYRGSIIFGDDQDADECASWIDVLEKALPLGTVAAFELQPDILDVTKLGKAHIGRRVTVWVDSTQGEVAGTLGAVYPAGRHGEARVLVIDGKAYTVRFGNVEIGE